MDSRTVLVLGSGPIRIGQGIEFDYSCVHCVWALQQMGYRAILINNNPETVSTDFDTGDGLYFEPVTLDDVLPILEREKVGGVVVQFGGQTAINMAEGLASAGVRILGTSADSIAWAEDRDRFDQLLNRLGIPKPAGKAVRSLSEAQEIAAQVGFPVLVRPSFVLGGRAMEICYDEVQLEAFYGLAESANPGQPVLVDQYLLGKEAEVDVISDGETTFVPGIMEHIERAGVHSGDSMAVYPPVTLSPAICAEIIHQSCQLARALQVRGLMNIQFVIQNHQVFVLEVNPRASRTVPYLSKVTGIPMVQLATRCMMGESLKDHGYSSGLWVPTSGRPVHDPARPLEPRTHGRICAEADLEAIRTGQRPAGSALGIEAPPLYAVKSPVFSFQKLSRVEPSLGPEMKSTGEVLGIDTSYEAALYKALVGSGITFKPTGRVLLTVNQQDKPAAIQIARELAKMGYLLAATSGTHQALREAGIESQLVLKIREGQPNLLDAILAGEVSLMINSPGQDRQEEEEAARIRRACIETGVACITSIDTAAALAHALPIFENPERASCLPYGEYGQASSVRGSETTSTVP
ncbi:MAG TPA: carbamoyl-phosphate synthase large subunit [Fimbriimonadaceae bacterium]|nr:carbamoyl-phosphate synthase large subunit [Fimbriimonadaceae bacterium]HRJ33802.1 carbamoyl-phosphate synthase large subunit [Fimbriimonadaceae bacterium]